MAEQSPDFISPEIIREALPITSEEMEVDVCQTLDFSSDTTPGEPASMLLENVSEILKGSPGNTPFPSRMKPFLKRTSTFAQPEALNFSDDSTNVSLPLAPPPPNSPCATDSMLEEELAKEAKRQEQRLKEHLEIQAVLQLFDSSPNSEAVRRKRPKKNVGYAEEIPMIEPFEVTLTASAKERQRRKRNLSAIMNLKKIVPGLSENSSETEVCELTAKYIFFLKKKVGPDHDKGFLRTQIL